MDALDQKILEMLRQNARASFTAMAAEAGTSEGTVRARVKRLTDDGIITQFTIKTAGRQLKALVDVTVQSNVNSTAIAETIAGWEDVEAVWEVTGDVDMVVLADCPDTGALNEIIDRVRAIPGTEATRSRLILAERQ